MKYKLHYAKLKLEGDIPCLEFTSKEDVRSFITSIVYPLKMINEKVYLIAIQDEIFVTEDVLLIEELFNEDLYSANPFCGGKKDIFIQEYNSYEAAYKVALEMKEPNPLCYE
jgi:hypothetical protein